MTSDRGVRYYIYLVISRRKNREMNQERVKTVYVIGHTTPDTDSVCSAMAYAYFKNITDKRYTFTPVRAGKLNHETLFVLEKFGVPAPAEIESLAATVSDLSMKKPIAVHERDSVQPLALLMKDTGVRSLPVVDDSGRVTGIVGLKDIARHYMESGIFNNALYGVITAIIGVILVAVIAVYALFGFFAEIGIASIWNAAEWTTLTQIDWANMGLSIIGNFITNILLALVILFAFVVITAILLRKSLGLLSAKTGIGLFGATGTMILIGAILTIIVIGVLLLWISLLLLAVAFFQIKPQQPQPPPPPV